VGDLVFQHSFRPSLIRCVPSFIYLISNYQHC